MTNKSTISALVKVLPRHFKGFFAKEKSRKMADTFHLFRILTVGASVGSASFIRQLKITFSSTFNHTATGAHNLIRTNSSANIAKRAFSMGKTVRVTCSTRNFPPYSSIPIKRVSLSLNSTNLHS